MLEGSWRCRGRQAGAVLIVDDDLETLEALAEIVGKHAHPPLRAVNGRDALAVLSRVEGPCLILLDLFMPVMDGFQFVRALERYLPPDDYSVVVMTASNAATPIHPGVVGRLDMPCAVRDVLWILEHLTPWNRESRRIAASR